MSQTALNALVTDTRSQLRGLAGQASAGQLDPRLFGRRVADLLEDAHTQAVIVGRTAGGDAAPEEDDDRLFALHVTDDEMPFLQTFVKDLETGDLSEAQVRQRAESYAGRLTGTANEALSLAADDDEWWWRLGEPETGHCTDCPELAANSPYRREELPTVPGNNETSCMFRCRCRIETKSGLHGFTQPRGDE